LTLFREKSSGLALLDKLDYELVSAGSSGSLSESIKSTSRKVHGMLGGTFPSSEFKLNLGIAGLGWNVQRKEVTK
jgi:hypothetical protein